MRRTRTGKASIVAVVVALAATILTLSGGSPASAAVDPAAAEAQFLSLLNQSRAAHGLGPLARDAGVDRVARAWSASMASVYARTGDPVVKPYAPNDCTQSALCHRPDLVAQVSAVEPNWQLIGENIGTGFAVGPLHESFMASGGHRANILGNYNRVGIGVVSQGDRIWVTFDFLNGPPISGSTGIDAAVPVPVTGALLPGPVVPLSSRTRFNAINPARFLDTRIRLGAGGILGAGGTLRIKLGGTQFAPSGAGGVAVNLTATEARGSGYLTVYPCAQGRPLASNLNVVAGATRANHTVVALDSSGYLCIFSSVTTHVVADLAGWYGGNGSAYKPVTPVRVRDTRQTGGRVHHLVLPLAGRVPADATAVTLNLTATEPAWNGYLTAYPCEAGSPPNASSLNYRAGQTVPNLVTVRLGPSKQVCVFSLAPSHIVADLAGSYTGSGTTLTASVPDRFLDTRDGTGGWLGALGAGQKVEVPIGGRGGVPKGATAAVLNITVTQTFASGWLVAYPCDSPRPTASNLNFVAGDTVPNLVVVRLDGSGRVCLTSNVRTFVVADLAGWFTN